MKNFNDEINQDAGIEFARYVTKEHPYTSRVILTATADIEPVKLALRENIVDDYFNKDDIGDLKKRVSIWLEERKLKFRTIIGDLYLVDPLDFYNKKCKVSSRINDDGGVVEFGPAHWRARSMHPVRETHFNKGEEVIIKAINIDSKNKEITSLRVASTAFKY